VWIETCEGDLLNLDHVSRVFVGTDRLDRQVCLYARLDEKKEAAHVDIVLGVFPIDTAHPVDAAMGQARQSLLALRQQLTDCRVLLACATGSPASATVWSGNDHQDHQET